MGGEEEEERVKEIHYEELLRVYEYCNAVDTVSTSQKKKKKKKKMLTDMLSES